ncbi:hypothetical protein GEMRC1_009799 [Eukaryota sp. GEM-RC1]
MSTVNIKVAVRVRPLVGTEPPPRTWSTNNCVISADSFNLLYQFDHVFDESSSNSHLYNSVASPIVLDAINGFHGTIFAYGQTSSGKTHTMIGSEPDPGIIYRALLHIFDHIESSPERRFLCRVSFIEIYNEDVFDLLEPRNSPYLRTDPQNKSVILCNVLEYVVMSVEEALEQLEKGNQRRHVGVTRMNYRSSRSHAVFRIILESKGNSKDSDGAVRISHLNLVDLAGSERASQTGAKGTQLREASNINKSLLYLGTLIAKLQSNPNAHINYRDSKLTHVLMNALGGNSLTAMICCINAAYHHFEVSKTTLEFATRAKNVKNKAKVNEVLDDRALLKKYEKDIKQLKEKNLQLMLNQRTFEGKEPKKEFNRRFTWFPGLTSSVSIESPTRPVPKPKNCLDFTSFVEPLSSTLGAFDDFKPKSESSTELLKKDRLISELTIELEKFKDQVSTLESDKFFVEKELNEKKLINTELSSEIQALKNSTNEEIDSKLQEFVALNSTLESQLKEKEIINTELSSEIQALKNSTNEEIDSKLQEFVALNSTLESQLKEKEIINTELSSEIQALKNSTKEEIDSKLQELVALNSTLESQLKEKEVINTELSSEIQALKISTNEEIDSKLQELVALNSTLESQLKEKEVINTVLSIEIQALKISTNEEIDSKLQELVALTSTLESQLKKKEVINTELSSEIQALKNSTNEEIDSKLQELVALTSTLESQLKEKEVINTELSSEIQALKNSTNDEIDSELQESVALISTLESQLKDRELVNTELSSVLQALCLTNEEMESKSHELVTLNSTLESQLQEKEFVNTELSIEIQFLKKSTSGEIDFKIQELVDLNYTLESQLKDKEVIITELSSEIQALKNSTNEEIDFKLQELVALTSTLESKLKRERLHSKSLALQLELQSMANVQNCKRPEFFLLALESQEISPWQHWKH